jgi:hypothetical protein
MPRKVDKLSKLLSKIYLTLGGKPPSLVFLEPVTGLEPAPRALRM